MRERESHNGFDFEIEIAPHLVIEQGFNLSQHQFYSFPHEMDNKDNDIALLT